MWLNPSVYGLPEQQAYVVSPTARSFKTADGKGGAEWFSHGGAFPEEIIVPWILLSRGIVVHHLNISIEGSGVAGQVGQLSMSVTNLNDFEIVLQELTLLEESSAQMLASVQLSQRIAGSSSERINIPLAPWPSVSPEIPVLAKLQSRYPSSDEQVVQSRIFLQSKALYRQADILGDLE
jgi:hypothetical protein